MLAVGAMDVLRPVRVAVRMRVHDLRVRQEFFPAGAFGKAQDAVRVRADFLNIVRDHKDRDLFLDIQMVKDVKEPVDGFRINTDRRFVQDQDLRIPRQDSRQHDALLLSAGKISDQFLFLIQHTDAHEGAVCLLLMCFSRETHKSDLLIKAAHDDFFACRRKSCRAVSAVLRKIPDARSRQRRDRLSGNTDLSFRRTDRAQKELDHGTFTHAVIADDDGKIALFDGKIHILQDHVPRVAEGHIFNFDHIAHFLPLPDLLTRTKTQVLLDYPA